MTRHLSLILLIIALSTAKGWTCDCDYGGPFLKMAPKTQLVGLIKVTKYLSFKDIYGKMVPMSMEAEIISIYRGVEVRRTIIVWGDPGHLCRPYLSTFKQGQYYVMALYPGNANSGHRSELATDYSIGNCGTFWLTVDFEKNIAIGDIDGKDYRTQSIELTRLDSEIKKNGH